MSELVDTLKRQHAAILGLAEGINTAVRAKDGVAATAALERLKTALLAHLALEDAQLYPGLTAFAEKTGEAHVGIIARAFSSNMERISAALVAFLQKYDDRKQALNLAIFEKDWGVVLQALGSRIQSEETSLYPLYNKAERDALARPKLRAPSAAVAAKG